MNLLARKTGHSLIRVRVISGDLFCGPALYVEAGVRASKKESRHLNHKSKP